MSARPSFYLPVISPPLKETSQPPAYYAGIEALGVKVTALSLGGNGALEITVTGSNLLHPSSHAEPLPFSTVYSPTAGSARFYPANVPLPTPAAQPIDIPPNVTTPASEIGSVVVRIWIADYEQLKVFPYAPRPTRIVLGRLQQPTVETAFKAEIAKLKSNVLETSWKEAMGTGATPPRAALEAAFLQRFMAGDAEIFVAAGTVLGQAAIASSSEVPPPSQAAQMQLQACWVPTDPSQSLFVSADDLIENAGDPERGESAALFAKHPLIAATSGPIDIRFRSRFLIWDNVKFEYVAFANRDVRLMKAGAGEVFRITTNADGVIDKSWTLGARDVIHFEYFSLGQEFGNRTFEEDIATEPHAARQYVNQLLENVNHYRAKHEVYPGYLAFYEALAGNEDENFDADRGTVNAGEAGDSWKNWKTGHFFRHFKEFERYYKASHPSHSDGKTFNVLFEGDSWFNYPLDHRDVYNHLDYFFRTRKKAGVTYNRIPLQHYGDRTDQMFRGTPGNRQWDFTADLLREYPIDLIVCGGGGNDLAEPGIGNSLLDSRIAEFFSATDSPLAEAFKSCFQDGHFNPYKATSLLSEPQLALATKLMRKSFAVLLNNHRWHRFLSGQSEAGQLDAPSMYLELDPQLLGLPVVADEHKDFGESRPNKQGGQNRWDISDKVLEHFPVRSTLPDPQGDAYDRLLATVFDHEWYKERFDAAVSNWRILLTRAQTLNIPVISHTYGYPLYNEEPTSALALGWTGRAGPWFKPRFQEARIEDRRIWRICVRVMIDNFVGYVLGPLKGEYPGIFDFADTRDLNRSASNWRDEIHLWGAGFGRVAERIYAIAAAKFPNFLS